MVISLGFSIVICKYIWLLCFEPFVMKPFFSEQSAMVKNNE